MVSGDTESVQCDRKRKKRVDFDPAIAYVAENRS